MLLHRSAFAVLRNTIWTSNTNNYIIGVQCTNDTVHGDRIVRPSADFRSCNRITSVCFHCTCGVGVCVLFYNGWNKSSNFNGFITSKLFFYNNCYLLVYYILSVILLQNVINNIVLILVASYVRIDIYSYWGRFV